MRQAFHRRAYPERRLYIMAKPDLQLAESIWSHPRSNRNRRPELLHVSLLPLFDLARFPVELLDFLRSLMTTFEASPFRVAFDHIGERRAVALRGSEPMRGAEALQEKLVGFLKTNGFPFFGRPREPHLTINYRRDNRGMSLIDPISWQVKELLLIESVHGECTHIEHDRWTLGSELNNDTDTALLPKPAPRLCRSLGRPADAPD